MTEKLLSTYQTHGITDGIADMEEVELFQPKSAAPVTLAISIRLTHFFLPPIGRTYSSLDKRQVRYAHSKPEMMPKTLVVTAKM